MTCFSSNEITILCYGDSNTRGSIPCTNHERYARQIRWPSRLQQLLGKNYYVIEEGLGGRTTGIDDPEEEGRNGKTSLLPCLRSHRPIDLVILLLGTNDLKAKFQMPAERIAKNAGELVRTIQTSRCGKEGQSPRVLLIAPPPLGELTSLKDEFEGGIEKSRTFGEIFLREAYTLNCEYLDAGRFIQSSNQDGIHWEPESHLRLAKVIAEKITSSPLKQ